MSKEVVKQIINQAKENQEFLQAVLKDSDTALQSYDLTEKEREFFRAADGKTLEGLKDSCFELVN